MSVHRETGDQLKMIQQVSLQPQVLEQVVQGELVLQSEMNGIIRLKNLYLLCVECTDHFQNF